MSKAMDEMAGTVQAAEAKLKVMEAWVCKIIRMTNQYLGRADDSEYSIKREAITEALQKYRLEAAFSGDTLVLSVKEVSAEEPKQDEEKQDPDQNLN
jgi:hypothetical protein